MKNNYKLIIGLLLLFIFTTTIYFVQKAYHRLKILQQPIANTVNIPDNSDKIAITVKDVISIFPIGDSKVYFEAKDKNGTIKIDSKEFNELIENQEKLIGKTKFTVVIKTTQNAKYKDMVDLLDKLAFLKIKRYSFLPITDTETEKINALP